MTGDYMVLTCLLWVTTLGYLSLMDYLARRRLTREAPGYLNLRLPKFIALMISSISAIVSLFLARNGLGLETAQFLHIPFFAAISYFTVVFFREIKNVGTKK